MSKDEQKEPVIFTPEQDLQNILKNKDHLVETLGISTYTSVLNALEQRIKITQMKTEGSPVSEKVETSIEVISRLKREMNDKEAEAVAFLLDSFLSVKKDVQSFFDSIIKYYDDYCKRHNISDSEVRRFDITNFGSLRQGMLKIKNKLDLKE